jgi:hypothetical protein
MLSFHAPAGIAPKKGEMSNGILTQYTTTKGGLVQSAENRSTIDPTI